MRREYGKGDVSSINVSRFFFLFKVDCPSLTVSPVILNPQLRHKIISSREVFTTLRRRLNSRGAVKLLLTILRALKRGNKTKLTSSGSSLIENPRKEI
jgi:hypothetical protein